MRVGVTLYLQAYQDWDRFEGREQGAEVAAVDAAADAKLWDEELDAGVMVEELGFDSLWTVEHHVSPYTMIPNPVQLLTYFAGATKRIDMGTMVVVLPWHHPLRVAEDITMLQYALKGRRAFIGFGRGAGRREFKQLGFDMNESRERFAEALQIIILAITEERFSFKGDFYQFEDVTMRPRPRDPQALIDDFHFSWGSPASAPIGASYGLKPLIIPQRPWAEYHADLATFGRARATTGLPPARPRLHMNVFCAETHDKAETGARRWIPEYVDSAARNYELMSDHFATTRGYEHYAQQSGVLTKDLMAASYLANHVWGTPAECIEKIKAISDAFHPEEYMLVMRYGGMPKDVADANTELFAAEVLPAVRAIPVEDPLVYEESATSSV